MLQIADSPQEAQPEAETARSAGASIARSVRAAEIADERSERSNFIGGFYLPQSSVVSPSERRAADGKSFSVDGMLRRDRFFPAIVLTAALGALAGCVRPAEDARLFGPELVAEDSPSTSHSAGMTANGGAKTAEVGRNPSEYAMTFETPVAAPEPPRRLDHTVVLGRDTAIWGDPSSGAPAAEAADGRAPAPTTVILQNNVQIAPNYGFGGYGYGYGYGYGSSVTSGPSNSGYSTSTTTTRPATPPPGGDWPAPPSYGPRPFR
jgi:hypothetical protein